MIPKPVIIDISEWQLPSKIDYDKLAKQISGVIVRIQYGSAYEDKHYRTHIREFKKRGIPIAVYAWVRGVDHKDMEKEAELFWLRGKEFEPSFWWLDIEEFSMADMRSGCEYYRRKLKKSGAKKVGAYIANHLYQRLNIDTKAFDGIWLPTYGVNDGFYLGADPTASKNYDLHQYTSNGRLPGYNGALDLNRLNGKPFDYFFDKNAAGPVEGGTITMKTFTLMTDIYLRKAADPKAAAITLLKQGQQVKINDICIANGYLWGIQPRDDGSKGFLALGEFSGFGRF